MTGTHSFVYISNMSYYQPTRDLHVHGPRVRILFAQFRSVGRWRFDDLRAPYWRLYHLAQPGAWVGCSGQSLRQHRPQIVCRDDAHDHLAIAQGLGRMVEDRFVVLATDEDREQFVARYNLRHASD